MGLGAWGLGLGAWGLGLGAWGLGPKGGRGLVTTSTSAQIPNQKTSNNEKEEKKNIIREQHSKQANIRQGKLGKVSQKV